LVGTDLVEIINSLVRWRRGRKGWGIKKVMSSGERSKVVADESEIVNVLHWLLDLWID